MTSPFTNVAKKGLHSNGVVLAIEEIGASEEEEEEVIRVEVDDDDVIGSGLLFVEEDGAPDLYQPLKPRPAFIVEEGKQVVLVFTGP